MGLGACIDDGQRVLRRSRAGRARHEDVVDERVGVARPHAELALRVVAQLAVLLKAARTQDVRELAQRLARSRFDVGELGCQCFRGIGHGNLLGSRKSI